jgi:hypothetical protein
MLLGRPRSATLGYRLRMPGKLHVTDNSGGRG